MKKNQSISKQMLKGQTLIEVLSSLSILSLVFVMGMSLFQQIVGINSPPERQQTRIMVDDFISDPISPFAMESERYLRGRELHRKVQLVDPKRNIFQITVSAHWNGILLERRNKVVQTQLD